MRKAKRIPGSPYARYAVLLVPESARSASPALVRHHVRKAIDNKHWAASVSEEWKAMASGMSLDLVKKFLSESVHVLARKSLEYHRLRAHGTYRGYPTDKPAWELWQKLSGRTEPK